MPSLKCQQCEGVLLGATVICKQCGFNNALQHRKAVNPSTQPTTTAVTPAVSQSTATGSTALNLAPLAAKVRARYAPPQEANLLQFPVTAVTQTQPTQPEIVAAPDWREKTRARVRQHLGQPEEQALETSNASVPAVPELDPTAQLLVESALKRIRRVSLPQPATEKLRERRAALKDNPVALAALDEPVIVRAPQQWSTRSTAQHTEAPSTTLSNHSRETTPANTLPSSRYENGKVQLQAHSQSPSARFAGYETHNNSNLAFQPEFLPEIIEELPVEAKIHEPVQPATSFSSAAPSTKAFLESTSASASEMAYDTDAEELIPEEARSNHFATVITALPQASESVTALTEVSTADQTDEYVATEEELAPIRWKGQPAPIWLRTLAGICDIEFITLVFAPFFGVYFTLDNDLEMLDYYTLTAMFVVVTFLYQLITYYFNGRTFGMVLFGLRNVDVVDASRYVGFTRRFKQALGGTVSLLCPPFNYLVTRVTGYQRGFGDALGQTLTLRKLQDKSETQ